MGKTRKIYPFSSKKVVDFSGPKVPVFNTYFQLPIFGFAIPLFARNQRKTGALCKSGKQAIFPVFYLVKWVM
jgi:hypothetical protein